MSTKKKLITEITTMDGTILPLPNLPDEDKLNALTKGHRNRRGRPTKPIDPLALVEVSEDGSVVEKKKLGRKTRFQLALNRISPGLFYDMAKLYYRTPDLDTMCLITGHKREFLTTMMQTAKWQEAMLQVRKELDREEEARATEIIRKALDTMQTSLNDGDEILDSKTGKIIKMKVKGHVAASMAKTAAELRKDARNENKNSVSPADTLHHINALANAFAAAVKKPGDDAKVIDHE